MLKLQNNEQLLISTLLKSEEKRKQIFNLIDNPDYYLVVDECRSIFNTIKRLDSSKRFIDVESVNSFCKARYEVIRDIYDNLGEISENNIDEHLKVLKNNALENDLSNKYYTHISEVLGNDNMNVEYKANVLKDAALEIEERQTNKTDDLLDMRTLIEKQKELFEVRKQGKYFRTTGDRRLDELMTYGLIAKEISVIAGRPSNGKSLYRLECARKLANQKIPVAIFNLEMRNESDMDRLLSICAQIDSTRLVKCFNQMEENELHGLYKEMQRMSNDMTLNMCDNPVLDLDMYKSILCRQQDKIKQDYIIVYIDLFTKMVEFGEAKSAFDIEKICNKIQKITKELGVHNILVLQINRSADKERLNGIADVSKIYPRFSQIKNAGAFEEMADNIFLICKPSNYLNTYEWGEFVPRYLRVEIAKQRGGKSTTLSNVLLYKNNNNYLGLIEPEKDWGPLKTEVTDEDLERYMS